MLFLLCMAFLLYWIFLFTLLLPPGARLPCVRTIPWGWCLWFQHLMRPCLVALWRVLDQDPYGQRGEVVDVMYFNFTLKFEFVVKIQIKSQWNMFVVKIQINSRPSFFRYLWFFPLWANIDDVRGKRRYSLNILQWSKDDIKSKKSTNGDECRHHINWIRVASISKSGFGLKSCQWDEISWLRRDELRFSITPFVFARGELLNCN